MNKSKLQIIHYNDIYVKFKNKQKQNYMPFVVTHMWTKKKKEKKRQDKGQDTG